MIYKENVLDRIEQSFIFMKDNFLNLFLPLSIFYILWFYVFYWFWDFLMWFIDIKNIFSPLNFLIFIAIFILIITYLLLDMLLIIWIYKTIIDIDSELEINFKNIFKYSYYNLFNIFKVYYYIFIYVFLIPSIIFIVWWIYFLYLQCNDLINLSSIDKSYMLELAITWFSIFIWFIIYISYKSNKAIFWVVSAIAKEDFNRQNFNNSVNLTNWNWWRIFWNFLLIWIIISLLTSLINSVFQINTLFEASTFVDNIPIENKSVDLKKILEEFKTSNPLKQWILEEITWRIIMIITLIFTSIFTYIFYKRLEFESSNINKIDNSEEIKNEISY